MSWPEVTLLKLRSTSSLTVDVELRPAETSTYFAFYLVIVSVLICMIRSFCWERLRARIFSGNKRTNEDKSDDDSAVVVPVM